MIIPEAKAKVKTWAYTHPKASCWVSAIIAGDMLLELLSRAH